MYAETPQRTLLEDWQARRERLLGNLGDVGLLSDLLVLPPLEDEHPDERAALVQAMQSIAQK